MCVLHQVYKRKIIHRLDQAYTGLPAQDLVHGSLDVGVKVHRVNKMHPVTVSRGKSFDRFTDLPDRLAEIFTAVRSHQDQAASIRADSPLV